MLTPTPRDPNLRVVLQVLDDFFRQRADLNFDTQMEEDGLKVSSEAVTAIRVKRDGNWRTVLANLLVKGDTVSLVPGDLAPCYCQQIIAGQGATGQILTRGQKLVGVEASANQLYKLLETPASVTARRFLVSERRPESAHAREMRLVHSARRSACIGLCILSLIGNIATVVFQEDGVAEEVWPVLLIAKQAYVVLALTSPGTSHINLLTSLLGSAYILAFFKEVLNEAKDGSKIDDDDPPEVSFGSLLEARTARGQLVRNTDLVHALGTTTVLACVDKDGILANAQPSSEKLVLPGTPPVFLDLLHDVTSASSRLIRFADPGWRTNLPSLRSIGIICLLNNQCRLHKHAQQEIPEAAFCDDTCSHHLAMEIGFSEDIADGYAKKSKYKLLRPGRTVEVPAEVRSVVVVDPRKGGMQLLSSGHPLVILEACTHVFNGETLQPLTKAERKNFANTHKMWDAVQDLQCEAFAYRPLTDKDQETLKKLDATLKGTPQAQASNVQRTPTKMEEVVSWDDRVADGNPLREDMPRRNFARKPAQSPEQQAKALAACELQRGLVFLGICGKRHQAKVDAVDEIDDLRKAGIRFMHFDSRRQRRGLAFAERLGLDADWNCCISLEDKQVVGEEGADYVVPDEYDEEEMDINTAKLPQGIEAIRDHIEVLDDYGNRKVDNIPLIVPLFTRATPATTLEMVRMLQENGEVVVVLGSSLNSHNVDVFSQADVAVSVTPSRPPISRDRRVPRMMFQHQAPMTAGGQLTRGPRPPSFVSRCTLQKLEIAKLLNELPCALKAPPDIHSCLWVSVIKMARRMHDNSLMVAYFSLGAQACLASFATVTSLLQLPAAVTGLPILWLSLVIIPLLALPLLASEPDEEIMHQIYPKNEPHKQTTCGGTATLHRLVKYFCIRFVPTAIVCGLLYAQCIADITGLDVADVFKPDALYATGWKVGDDIDYDSMAVLACPRATTLWFCVMYLIMHGSGFIHRAEGWWQAPIYQRNQIWCGFAVVVLLLQSLYTVVALLIHERLSDVAKFSWLTWSIGFGWPIFIYILDNMMAKRDDGNRGYGRKTDDFGRELWLDFNTKLGMHSPV